VPGCALPASDFRLVSQALFPRARLGCRPEVVYGQPAPGSIGPRYHC
jgi:hypothetical protein